MTSCPTALTRTCASSGPCMTPRPGPLPGASGPRGCQAPSRWPPGRRPVRWPGRQRVLMMRMLWLLSVGAPWPCAAWWWLMMRRPAMQPGSRNAKAWRAPVGQPLRLHRFDDPQFQAELRAFIEETVADQIRRRGSIAQAVEALVRASVARLASVVGSLTMGNQSRTLTTSTKPCGVAWVNSTWCSWKRGAGASSARPLIGRVGACQVLGASVPQGRAPAHCLVALEPRTPLGHASAGAAGAHASTVARVQLERSAVCP